MIPITTVRCDEETETLVLEVLRSGQLAQGSWVEQLEKDFAEVHEVKHAVAVNNGTTALVAALRVLDIGPGDEVITSPFTFVATLNAILEAGATIRFADIGDDFNMDPSRVEEQIGKRTRCLLPVHLYGLMADMDLISVLAEKHELRIVEDAAQAVGAMQNGRFAGSFDVGCFSLYATKNISTGEGGMLTTNDDALADRLRLLRNQGMRARYEYEEIGHNYRLTNLAAAVGIPQINRLGEINKSRQANAKYLSEGLSGIEGLLLPPVPNNGRNHVYHQFTIRITQDAACTREEFVDSLGKKGVGSGIYYPKVAFDYECYKGVIDAALTDVPNAVQASKEVVSLPVHPYLESRELEEIVDAVRKVMGL